MRIGRFVCALLFVSVASPIFAEQTDKTDSAHQAKLEAALAKSLSGATLEGSYTRTGAGSDPGKLSREKYTLGEVKKVSGGIWQIPARIK